MKVLKKYVRKSHQPLQQAVKRYNESTTYRLKPDVNNSNNSFILKNNHTNEPINKELIPCSCIQYKTMIFNNFEIKINHESDSFVQTTDGDIVKIINICKTKNEVFILGYSFLNRLPYYKKPIDSIKLGISLVDDLTSVLNKWPIENIKNKCMVLNLNNKTIAFSLIHTIKL